MTGWPRTGLWWVPVLFAALLAGVGSYSYRALERSTRGQLREQLQTILEADVEALRLWLDMQRAVAAATAHDLEVREATAVLAEIARVERNPRDALLASQAQLTLRGLLVPILQEHAYQTYAVLDRSGIVLAAATDGPVGRRLAVDAQRFERVLSGGTTISRPLAAAPIDDSRSDIVPAVMRSAAPVRDAAGVIGVLGFAIPAEAGFTQILSVARMGESGETYAFDAQGVMLSQSRFEDELVTLGLLPDEPGAHSLLNIEIRDPGGSLRGGHEPSVPLRARPLTRMAASAVAGESGFDVDGYRDYRGVPVIGAWTWLADLQMGVTTEIDLDEAYAGLYVLRRSFGALAGVMVLASLGMFVYTVVLGRLQRRFEKARQLGRYQILEKIGEGGMGKVYRAKHSLLRRPTAVKLLESGSASSEAIARFEREVQSASSLTHPNTISIYDYGHTPDGTFYYAMELLEGITVTELVEADGPQPEGRVIHVMKQAASSLSEAHAQGLIHRDLKPSNIMLCTRGGLRDFVKVLDFGLVRAQDRTQEVSLTKTTSLTGTPLYLSPEALEAPDTLDVRADVYQLGAVAYYLLTGRHVFTGDTVVQVLSQHLNAPPKPPSEVLGRDVSESLERLILACLEKERAKRPSDGGELFEAFEACVVGDHWAQREAREWWDSWSLRHHPGSGGQTTGSLPSGWQVDLTGRSGATH